MGAEVAVGSRNTALQLNLNIGWRYKSLDEIDAILKYLLSEMGLFE